MLTSAALAVVIVASGYGLTAWFGVPLRGEERLFVGAITAPVVPLQAAAAVNASAAFTDTNPANTHTAVWNWGDGTTSDSAGQVDEASRTVTGSHIYATAGVYTVTRTVTVPG